MNAISAVMMIIYKGSTQLIALNTDIRRYDLLATWPGVIKDLMEDEDFGVQLKKNIPRTNDLDEQLKTITDQYQKMITIHILCKRQY